MATIIASGDWWTLDSDGVLSVFCVGDMPSTPWGDYSDQIISVIISDGVTSILENAFYGCESLTSVAIPASVAYIDYCAFEYCSSLASITIPASVTSIGEGAFENCIALASVTISGGLDSISDRAFFGCSSLTSVTIPDSVTSIGELSFAWNVSLESVIISNSVVFIGDGAFKGCGSLTDVYYTGTEQQWNAITIDEVNDYLTDATIHYNYAPPEPEPAATPKIAYTGQSKVIKHLCELVSGLYAAPRLVVDSGGYICVDYGGTSNGD